MFSPGDRVRYQLRTLGACVLATVVGPSPNWPHFCHLRYICPGGVTQVDHESSQPNPNQPHAPLPPPPHQPLPCARHANRICATVQSVLFLYPEVLYRSFGSPITFVLRESHWQSINAKIASPVFCLLPSVEGATVCLEIPLQPPPPPPGRPSLGDPPPAMGDRCSLQGEIARGGEGGRS